MNAKSKISSDDPYLQGQLLIAMPTMADKRFRRAVIYMCRHSEDGAMGLIVNQRTTRISYSALLEQLNVVDEAGEGAIPDDVAARAVHIGGPVSTERGFVLHTADYVVEDSTLRIADGICLTATVDILKSIANGEGPRASILALGYAGWAPGQLESEIQANGWLHCPADHDLVFATDVDQTYHRALASLGVDPTFLVSEAGHA